VPESSPVRGAAAIDAPRPVPYPEIPRTDARRASTGIEELDRVLGGGLVPGAIVLVGGEPGIGKSTLLLQAAASMAERGSTVLYATGEESAAQLRLRGDRLGVTSPSLLVLAETDVDAIAERSRESGAGVVVVDSIQAVRCADLDSVPGSVAQVRECAGRFVSLAKGAGIPVLLVGHVTKDGALAGPRVLEHMVDAVLQFEGDRHLAHRLLRSLKNRFGASDELAVFSMSEDGLRGVRSPSEMFLAERPVGAPGSAVLAAIEGTRPLLVEIQALVGEPVQGSPRRTAVGVDANRVAMLLAVLERRAGPPLSNRDVFVNVTGGLSVAEPAADLAVAAAAASSVARVPLPDRWVILGEVGLTGEVRAVARTESRLREAGRMGFVGAVLPAGAAATAAPDGMRRVPVRNLAEALDALFALSRGEAWHAGSPAPR
jgi:DNA repair protein RadA/Sms